MFLGHYALALGTKRVAPEVSLGTLILATQLLDLLWPILLLLGLEHVRIVPGLTAASPLDFIHYPYTHSLAMAGLWGAALGAGYYALRRSARGAWVVGLLVVSHWFLDALVHRPDLPLWPGSRDRVGAGLWNWPAATIVLELGMLALGLAIYLRMTRAADAKGSWGLWALIAFLLFAFFGSFLGPPPPDVPALAISALALWLLVPWGYWVDRHRAAR